MLPDIYKVVDGGLATELERRGHDINDDPLWSARLLQSNPDEIVAVHKSYLEHGADIIITATYQASVDNLSQNLDLDETQAKELIKKGVCLAQNAREQFWESLEEKQDRCHPLIAGSVGPYGAILHDGSEYNGHYVDTMSEEELEEWHLPRVEALLEAGVDLLAFETIPALKEAQALLNLLHKFPHAKAWLSLSCQNSEETCHEERFADVVKVCAESNQLVAIGINCTNPKYIEGLLEHVQDIREKKPFIVYPNSGELWVPVKGWYNKNSDLCLTDYVKRWVDLGATWIGGCCRTTPQDIAVIRQTMNKICEK